MKNNKLPPFWCVKRDKNNPDWQKVIDYLNIIYGSKYYTGDADYYVYYGYDNNNYLKGTNNNENVSCFENNPTLLTIEQFVEMTEVFVLPEKWCIKAKLKEEENVINNYARSIGGKHWCDIANYAKEYYLHVKNNEYCKGISHVEKDYKEITFEQFKKYVMQNKISYIITNTSLPSIKEGIEYRLVTWSNKQDNSKFHSELNNLVSFGSKIYKNELYVLAERKDYGGRLYFMFKVSDIEKLANPETEEENVIPEYVECIEVPEEWRGGDTILGKIYKTDSTCYPVGKYRLVFDTGGGQTTERNEHCFKPSTKELFEQQNLKKEIMKTITPSQAQEIIDVACSTWKEKLFTLWGKKIVLKISEIEISDNDYQEMRKACNQSQNELFDTIFGKECKFKVGDWVTWTGYRPLTAQIISFSGEYCDLNGDSHDSCSLIHIRLATVEEIKKAQYIPEGTACLVRNNKVSAWKLSYATGNGKFKGSTKIAVYWEYYQILDINNLPKY